MRQRDADWADEAVDEILGDLNQRSGFDMCDVDNEVMNEIREKWAAIIRSGLRSIECESTEE